MRKQAMLHHLKTWPECFQAVSEGRKRFDIRKNDRDFNVLDTLSFREWCPEKKDYTGRRALAVVGYILEGGFGLESGYVCMSISLV